MNLLCAARQVCGVGVDPELLRISTVLNNLEKKGIEIGRFNLSNNPGEFMLNMELNKLIMTKGWIYYQLLS